VGGELVEIFEGDEMLVAPITATVQNSDVDPKTSGMISMSLGSAVDAARGRPNKYGGLQLVGADRVHAPCPLRRY
jgi:hypothetical protein